MNQLTIRIALIGTGGIASAHVQAVADQAAYKSAQAGTAVELVAAVDIDAARLDAFCDKYEIAQRYTDVATMLEQMQPHVVMIATPPFTHCDLAVQCMDAGAWVLCEKPLCASLAEMDRIEAAEARNGVYCSSVFQWRFGSGGAHLKRLIAQNALGRPLVGTALITWFRTPEYYAVPWRGKWATELGGTTVTHGIHAFDFVLWLLGEWQEVRAMTGTLDRAIEVEDVAMALVRLANGAMITLTSSVLSPRQASYLRFDFQKATVELTTLYGYRNVHWRYAIAENAPYADELAQWQDLPPERAASHGSQLTAFLASRAAGERPAASGPDVRGTIEFLSSLYKAAQTGQPVQRGEIDQADPFYGKLGGSR
ncbi:MAG: Gfo/Idh/MocA family oxidoreductase [Litorilinea sp.]